MKTVLKYIFAGFLLISVLVLGILQIIQFNFMNGLNQNLQELKTNINTLSNPSITPTNSILPTITTTTSQTMVVKLFYKNYIKDPNVNNCEADSYIEKTIPKTTTPLFDTIKLLLTNNLTTTEKNLGLETTFNTTDASKQLSLVSASIANGKATLTFNDPANFTSNGSCGSGILSSQVTLTAKQFSTVSSVEILPVSAFQP